ncbi:MAG: VWA domain-containing protein [Rhodococcus sp.]|nr:VWA domain-containing protein [Rhodococcus sp. (in: high G+C Gram-positive bacteria)]
MGEHRGAGGVRGVSKGPLIVLVLVALLVAVVFGWFQLRERIDKQADQAAGMCVEGESVLHVTAEPDIAPVVETLAQKFSDTDPVIRDRCVRVEVASAQARAVVGALNADSGEQWDDSVGPRPNLWIPGGSSALTELEQPDVVAGEPHSIAVTPIVLAVPRVVAAALSAEPTGWQDLPALQSTPTSLEDRGLPGWGSLRLALPIGPDSAPTGMAVQAVAAAVAGAPTGPVTPEQLDTASVRTAVATLSRNAPVLEPSDITTSDSLTGMIEHAEDADATVHAVPATEQQIYRTLHDDEFARVDTFLPSGATPVADYPAAILTGSDETQSRAAAQLVEFLGTPDNAQLFADAGFRVPGTTLPTDTPLEFPDLGTPLVPADRPTATDLEHIVTSPIEDRATTILLDESQSMADQEGADTRLGNTTAALAAQIEKTPDTSSLGLWEYSQDLGEDAPYLATVSTGPLGENDRRQALTEALDAAEPATGSWTYSSLAAAYQTAVDNYVPGRTNSILLITDGVDDQEGSTRAELLSAIAEASDESTPVQIDVITIGENQTASTFGAVAERTGGTVRNVDSSDGPALTEAITEFSS